MAIYTGLFSAAMFVGSLAAVPWLIARAPRDLFTRTQPPRGSLSRRIARNVFGVFLIAVGVAMLVLPGQGLLSLLAGICLADLPGKQRLLRALAKREPVWRALEHLRNKAGVPPFDAPT